MKFIVPNANKLIKFCLLLMPLMVGCTATGGSNSVHASEEGSFYRIAIYSSDMQTTRVDSSGVLAFFNNFFLHSTEYNSLDHYVIYKNIGAIRNDFNNGIIDIAIIYHGYNDLSSNYPISIYVNPVTLSDSDKVFISDAFEYMGLTAGLYIKYWGQS